MKKRAKVAMFGCGRVGISAAYTMYLKNIAGEIMLYSRNPEKLIGEQLDFQHSLSFVGNTAVTVAEDIADLKNSDIIVYSAGVAQESGETRLNLTTKNTELVEATIPEIVKHAPNAIIIMVTNPVDILTYKAFQIAGIPSGRLFGSGTTLDTARFRFHLSGMLHVNSRSIHAYILGEHGDSSFPAISSANVGGQPIITFPHFSKEKILEAYEEARNAAYKIIEAKGATYYAIGVVISELVYTILHDAKRVYPLSIPLEGKYGYHDVALSVPCILGKNGVERILEVPLSEEEKKQFDHSVKTLKQYLAE